jgi:hypothetical protein
VALVALVALVATEGLLWSWPTEGTFLTTWHPLSLAALEAMVAQAALAAFKAALMKRNLLAVPELALVAMAALVALAESEWVLRRQERWPMGELSMEALAARAALVALVVIQALAGFQINTVGMIIMAALGALVALAALADSEWVLQGAARLLTAE